MIEKLEKNSMEYMAVLYALYNVVSYYSKLLHLEVGDSPADISNDILELNNCNVVRFMIPRDRESTPPYTMQEIQNILNEYLRIAVLPQIPTLKPYHSGKGIHDLMECLFVDLTFLCRDALFIDVVYINSKHSYNYARIREQESRGGKK